jgi:hypothetical protein
LWLYLEGLVSFLINCSPLVTYSNSLALTSLGRYIPYSSDLKVAVEKLCMACGKMSKIDSKERDELYVKFIEDLLSAQTKETRELRKKLYDLENNGELFRTTNGFRLVRQANFNSIQWALTQDTKDLKPEIG